MRNVLIVFAIIFQIKLSAQNAVLNFNTIYPEAGKKVTFTYTGKLAKKGTKISYICHYLGSNFVSEKSIPYKVKNNSFVGSFIIPDSVMYVNIKIENKKEFDNNKGKGFGFNIYKNWKPIKGTYFAEGQALMLNDLLLNADVDERKALGLMEKEYALNPGLKNKTRSYYIDAIFKISSRKQEAVTLAKKCYDEILKTGKDENCTFRYVNIIANGNYNLRDSLMFAVKKKYPKGITAFNLRKWDLQYFSTEKPDTAIEVFNSIVRDFPRIDIDHKREIFDYLLTAYCNKLDCDNFDKTMNAYLGIDKSPSLYILSQKYNTMARNMFIANKNLERAKGYVERSLAAHMQKDSLSDQYGETLDTYAAILSKLGNKQGALVNQRKAVVLTNTTNVGINEKLLGYLMDNKLYDEAKQRAEEFIADKTANAQIEGFYKAAFIAVNGNDDGFNEILAKLNNKAEQDYIEQLRLKITDIPAPDFVLKNLNGNDVKLSDLRGSIVILDFWATWCTPCIGSFSAMQKVVNEMKDKNIVFLFINTQEYNKSGSRVERIRKILEDKKTTEFEVILDEKKGDEYMVQAAYKVSGYPSKYIIDRTGKIRFCSLGFAGDDALIKEMKTVVGLIDENTN